jgi:type VI secretion system protein VasJ
MLGPVKSNREWHWAAYGKHPVAKDFFGLGQGQPLVKALSEWVEKGCQILTSKGEPSSSPYSWRFWAKGLKRHSLVCGVVKDSCDLLGRPYPLLVMGTGSLDGWEERWDLLPFACERTWNQIEYLSTKQYKDLAQLKDDLRLFKQPNAQWSELVMLRNLAGHLESSEEDHSFDSDIRGIESGAARLAKEEEIFAPMNAGIAKDQFTLISLWHFQLKSHLGAIPNAAFMGGDPDNNYLAFFKRALRPDDFVRLWSVCTEGKQASSSG